MGCGSSAPEGETALNRSIDKSFNKQKAQEAKGVKILLLGSGESGKSTVLKQMKILHKNGFEDREMFFFRRSIRKNVVDFLLLVCQACTDLEIKLQPDSQPLVDKLNEAANLEELPLEIGEVVQALLKDAGIQAALRRSHQFYLPDSTEYFFQRVGDVFQHKYVPSLQDILRSRVATTGINETVFFIKGLKFSFFDVGGQRGERKKWIHCFEGVRAIMYIASLSEYDQVLLEDSGRNRLEESLLLFEGIANLPWFRNTPIILFLNKSDIFAQKITKTELGAYFPEYTGGLDYAKAHQFIMDQYVKRHSAPKNMFVHTTNATDTENIKVVWAVAQHHILKENLEKMGLMSME